jgi:hypothetical protein
MTEMFRLLGGSDRADPFALDDRTVERLLAGRLAPADVPPAYAGVARLLTAAAAPPSPEELAGQAAAVTQLQAVVRARPPVVVAGRAARSRRRFQARIAAIAVVGVLSVSGIAGASGLGEPIRRAAQTALAGIGIADPAAQSDGREAASAGPGPANAEQAAVDGLCRAYVAGGQDAKTDAAAFQALAAAAGGTDRIATYCQTSTASTTGTQQARHGSSILALQGLCRAYVAGQGGQHGAKTEATAFRALAVAAGGTGNIATYCQTITSKPVGGQEQGQGRRPSTPGGQRRGQDRPPGPPDEPPPDRDGPGHRDPGAS